MIFSVDLTLRTEPVLSKKHVCVLCTPRDICLETGDQCSGFVKVDAEAGGRAGDENLTHSLSCEHPLTWG